MNFDQLFEPGLEGGLPVMPSGSHIVLVGNPQRCEAASEELLLRFGIYVQPINYRRSRAGPSACASPRLRYSPMSTSIGWLRR
jgi:5-aminolevulinate synthase